MPTAEVQTQGGEVQGLCLEIAKSRCPAASIPVHSIVTQGGWHTVPVVTLFMFQSTYHVVTLK